MKTAVRVPKQYTIEQFHGTTGVRDASFSSDEKRILFSSNQTGVFNVYSVPVTGGEATNLTSSTTDTTYAISYFPFDDRVLYTRDQGGNELNHLSVRELDGTERDLTPGEKLKAQFDGWSGDRSAFWVETNERDPKFFDLYRYGFTKKKNQIEGHGAILEFLDRYLKGEPGARVAAGG